jgi:transglutaminase-like putative cysteine protease
LPWPKENHPRQVHLTLLNSQPKAYTIAPTDKTGQRSIYTTQRAVKDKPLVFSIKFSYTAYAQYFIPESIVCKPYLQNSALYKKYTREKLPHIVFSKPVTQIADSITKGLDNPLEKVQEIYKFITSNYIWSGALEYSIIPCIPEYVISNKKGDCGMQTFLFMSMARYKGIPVRWQSGWMLHPKNENLHDWCEVYYEGTGWVPLDMSFQYNISADKRIASYYETGIDAYRMIVNDEISDVFIPAKKFFRSEPYDFQRGELEWKGGNLYFDQWNYKMNIVYKSDIEKL